MRSLWARGLFVLLVALVVPVYADVIQVAGSSSGAFSNETTGSLLNSDSVWQYQGGSDPSGFGKGFIQFTGSSFGPANTTVQVTFGTILLSNASTGGGNVNGTADLNVVVHFTTPNGQVVAFGPDGLALHVKSGPSNSDSVELVVNGLPGSQSFTVGGEKYTVTYDGFFDSSNAAVTSLSVHNTNDPHSQSAFLKGTISADPVGDVQQQSAVPEPGSITLLGTVLAGIGIAIRRNRQVG